MSSGSAESSDFTFDKNNKLGKGGYGHVYRGTFSGRDVAIKKVQIDDPTPDRVAREYENMRMLDHPNVLKLLYWEDKGEFRFSRS